MARRMPAAESVRSAICPETSGCRTCPKKQTDAVDPADCAQPRVGNRPEPSRLRCSPLHRLSKTTRYRPLGMRHRSRFSSAEIDGAARASIRDKNCYQPESVVPLQLSKDRDVGNSARPAPYRQKLSM